MAENEVQSTDKPTAAYEIASSMSEAAISWTDQRSAAAICL